MDYFYNNSMTELDVIYIRKTFGILSVMKNSATEYIEKVRNPTSHNTLSISLKRVKSINCNNDHVCWAYKKEHTGEEHHNYSNSN
jgi:hypothetical protein